MQWVIIAFRLIDYSQIHITKVGKKFFNRVETVVPFFQLSVWVSDVFAVMGKGGRYLIPHEVPISVSSF